jgi:hypothetical protein
MSRRSLVSTLALLGAAAVAACDGGSGPDTLESIAISPDTAYVTLNSTATLQATARSSSGGAMTGVAFAWSSSDTTVATVSEAGVVNARRYGIATITASAEGVSGSATVWATGGPGLTVVTEPRDTIGAVASTELVAELRDASGRPRAGQQVRFDAVPVSPFVYRAQLYNPANGAGVATRSVFTDAQGRAVVQVRMGELAGEATIVASVESLNLVDSARVVVLPGAAAGVRVEPADSAVFLGRTLQLRGSPLDRAGNVTAGTVTFAVLDGPLAVDGGGLVSTPAYGTARITARVGARMDTARVSAVPVGAVAVSTYWGLVVMNLDGTGMRSLGSGMHPAWSPGGETLVFTRNDLLYVIPAGAAPGAAVPLVQAAPVGEQHWPRYSPDGAWVYHSLSVGFNPIGVWRVRADGTGLQRVTEDGIYGGIEGHPSLSPDGTRMVSFRGGGLVTVRARVLATGEELPSLGVGHTPTWSPNGEWIVFNALGDNFLPAAIMIARPDGTDLRRVSPQGERYGYSPRWSPDGSWIVASHGSHVDLIQVETGLVIELPYPADVNGAVAWKPGALLP